MKWLKPSFFASCIACRVRGVMQPEVVGSLTLHDSLGREPSELRGAGAARALLPPSLEEPPPDDELEDPPLAALATFNASSAWFLRLAMTVSWRCCSRTAVSIAVLACACWSRLFLR